MKKLLTMLLTLTLAVSMLAACSPKEEAKKEEPKQEETKKEEAKQEETKKEEPKQEETEKEGFTVGLVTDVGGIDDKSFNQGTYEGIVKFTEETGTEVKYVQSETDADYIPNLSTFADEEVDLIVAPGFLFTDAMGEVATNYPEQKFLIIDMVVDKPNVASAVFAAEQGSFLVGVACATKAKQEGKDTLGFLGGMDFDLIQAFEAGYEAGIKAVDPEMKLLVEYVGSFTDTQLGQTKSAKMYSEGAYIIFHAAGAPGNGLIKEAKDRRLNGEDVWACGVDKDQYADGIYEGEKSAVFTSMMKRVDVASYSVSKDVYEDKWEAKVLVFNLKNGGVGVPEENPNFNDEINKAVEEYQAKVISGEVEVPLLPSRVQ